MVPQMARFLDFLGHIFAVRQVRINGICTEAGMVDSVLRDLRLMEGQLLIVL
jgi:hypothetical protein